MLLKIFIVVLLLALVASLGAGFYYLMVDQGNIRKRRLVNSLGVRLSLAVTLMALIFYGVSSGKLRSQAPWEDHTFVPVEESED
jgi:succinate dehydrogenase/fumarate reductase cytochrome b subunit